MAKVTFDQISVRDIEVGDVILNVGTVSNVYHSSTSSAHTYVSVENSAFLEASDIITYPNEAIVTIER